MSSRLESEDVIQLGVVALLSLCVSVRHYTNVCPCMALCLPAQTHTLIRQYTQNSHVHHTLSRRLTLVCPDAAGLGRAEREILLLQNTKGRLWCMLGSGLHHKRAERRQLPVVSALALTHRRTLRKDPAGCPAVPVSLYVCVCVCVCCMCLAEA